MDGVSEPERYEEHDPRCMTLGSGEFNNICDCRILKTIDDETFRQQKLRLLNAIESSER